MHLTCVCKLISKESENKPPSEERGAEVRSSSRVTRASPLCVLPSSPCCGACAGGRVRGPGGAGRGRLLSFAGPQGWPMPPGSRGWWIQRRHRSQGESIRPLRNGNGSTPTFPQGPPRGQGQTQSARARPAGPLPLKDQVAPRGGPEPRDRPASMPWAALPPPPGWPPLVPPFGCDPLFCPGLIQLVLQSCAPMAHPVTPATATLHLYAESIYT